MFMLLRDLSCKAAEKQFTKDLLALAKDEAHHAMYLEEKSKSDIKHHRTRVMHIRHQKRVGISVVNDWMRKNLRIVQAVNLSAAADLAASFRAECRLGARQ